MQTQSIVRVPFSLRIAKISGIARFDDAPGLNILLKADEKTKVWF